MPAKKKKPKPVVVAVARVEAGARAMALRIYRQMPAAWCDWDSMSETLRREFRDAARWCLRAANRIVPAPAKARGKRKGGGG